MASFQSDQGRRLRPDPGGPCGLVAKRRDDRSEERVEFGLEAGQACDDANADNSSDEAVFDCRGARLVFSESEDLLHCNSPNVMQDLVVMFVQRVVCWRRRQQQIYALDLNPKLRPNVAPR